MHILPYLKKIMIFLKDLNMKQNRPLIYKNHKTHHFQ